MSLCIAMSTVRKGVIAEEIADVHPLLLGHFHCICFLAIITYFMSLFHVITISISQPHLPQGEEKRRGRTLHTTNLLRTVIFSHCTEAHWCAMDDPQVCHRTLGGSLLVGHDNHQKSDTCQAACRTKCICYSNADGL